MAATVTIHPTASSAPQRASQPRLSPWRLLALGSGLAVALIAVHPIIDIDLYWHLRLGNQIIATHSIDHAGSGFAYTMPGRSWVTTQWLSEVILATLYNLGGFEAVVAMRLAVSVALLCLLGARLLRGRSTVWSPIVFAVTILLVSGQFQARPELFSLFFVFWLAGVLRDEILDIRRHRLAAVMVVTWLWANVHGSWVLVPACYALLSFGWLVERRDTEYRKCLRAGITVIGTIAVGGLTPVGPRLLLAFFKFAGSTGQITEWRPSTIHNVGVVVFGLIVAALVAAWARSGHRVEASELVYVAGITAFAMYAVRDVATAALLLAPVALHRLELSFPYPDRISSERERKLIGVAAAVMVALGLVAVVARSVSTPAVPATVPKALAQRIAATPGEHRVLDDYNASGAVILWGGPLAKVAIDGRADRYGNRFITEYSKLMLTMGDWQQQLASLDPDFALLRRGVPLVRELTRQQWRVVGTDTTWVLLEQPDDPGAPK